MKHCPTENCTCLCIKLSIVCVVLAARCPPSFVRRSAATAATVRNCCHLLLLRGVWVAKRTKRVVTIMLQGGEWKGGRLGESPTPTLSSFGRFSRPALVYSSVMSACQTNSPFFSYFSTPPPLWRFEGGVVSGPPLALRLGFLRFPSKFEKCLIFEGLLYGNIS